MNKRQRIAISNPCLLAEETMHPRYGRMGTLGTTVLTVNTGYE